MKQIHICITTFCNFSLRIIMLSIARKRREAERNKKLEEQFNKADTNSNGKIRPKQMMKIFEANDISGKCKFIDCLIRVQAKNNTHGY